MAKKKRLSRRPKPSISPQRNSPEVMVPIVCKILERHPITHEPWKLQVIGYQETLDVTNHSEYEIGRAHV